MGEKNIPATTIVVAGQQQQTAAAANGWRAGKLALAFADADGTGAGVAFGKAPCRLARRPGDRGFGHGHAHHSSCNSLQARCSCSVPSGSRRAQSEWDDAGDRPATNRATDLTAS